MSPTASASQISSPVHVLVACSGRPTVAHVQRSPYRCMRVRCAVARLLCVAVAPPLCLRNGRPTAGYVYALQLPYSCG